MNNWMTVKVRYTKELDNGTFKRVTEPYLLAAMTFTDAEARIYEELGSIIRGEFTVVSITRTDLHDIFAHDDSDLWFKTVISFVGMSDDSEKEKKVKQTFMLTAGNVKEAAERLREDLGSMLVDFEIKSVSVSDIVEVFPFRPENERLALQLHAETRAELEGD
jgi:hypothetical protein